MTGAIVLVCALQIGSVGIAPLQAALPDSTEVVTGQQRIEIFSGDRIRLTHHDWTCSEGVLVSLSHISMTIADTTDAAETRVVPLRSIKELTVFRADSAITVMAYRVDRSWLEFYQATLPDSLNGSTVGQLRTDQE